MDIDKNGVAVEIGPHKITWDMIRYILCDALEGGSNYWYYITELVEPTGGPRPWPGNTEIFKHLDYPLMPGGALIIEDIEGIHPASEFKPVNRETLVRGVEIMAEKYPVRFAEMVEERDDADTGDCLLQCTCLGEVVFG